MSFYHVLTNSVFSFADPLEFQVGYEQSGQNYSKNGCGHHLILGDRFHIYDLDTSWFSNSESSRQNGSSS